MREVSHLLRKAYIDELSDLSINGINIPVFDEYVPDPSKEAVLNIGSHIAVRAHVKITNQTTTDASAKCSINQAHSIQLDITTTFPTNSGGYLVAEQISDEILQMLMLYGNRNEIRIQDVNVWAGWLVSARNISEYTDTSCIFRRVLIFNHRIQQ